VSFPFVSANFSLSKDPGQEIPTNVTPVRVRHTDRDATPDHELVLATRVGALKPECPERIDQIFARDRANKEASGNFLDGKFNTINDWQW
jgi:hypothetical protein